MPKIMIVILFFSMTALLPAQEKDVSEYLNKAYEHLEENEGSSIGTISYFHAINGSIQETYRLFERHKEVNVSQQIMMNLHQIAILNGQIDWLKEHDQEQDDVLWESDELASAQIFRIAMVGDLETLIELVSKLENRDFATHVLCECVDLFKRAGKEEAAKSAFAMALNESGGSVDQDLLNATLVLEYPPMIREFYRRWSSQTGQTDRERYNVLIQIGKQGFVKDALDLAKTINDERLRKRVESQVMSFASTERITPSVKAILESYCDPQEPRFRSSFFRARVCKLLLNSNQLDKAEPLIDEIAHKIDRVPLFARLAHAWLDQRNKVAGKRALKKAIERLKIELRDESTIQYSSQLVVAESRAMIGAAAIRLGDQETGEKFFSIAIDRALTRGKNNSRQAHHATEHLFNAFQLCDQPERGIELLIESVKAKRFTDENLVRIIQQLEPSIQAVVTKQGRQKALEPLKVLQTRTPRVTLIELVALAQLRHEGANADMSWVYPRKKDVPLTPLYLSIASERLRDRLEKIQPLISWRLEEH